MARTIAAKEREEFPMGAKEILLKTLRPHPLSFIRYYSVGILLLIWIPVTLYINNQGWLEQDWISDELKLLMPALLLALGAALIGAALVGGFAKGFRYLFWIAVIALLVVSGMFIWYWDYRDRADEFAYLFTLVLGIMGIVFAEFYRRAFKYMVTNQRVVIRYKLLSIEETNMRFEKIEDFEIVRPFIWRLAGLGTIRPYTGTEDAKADSDLSFHGPKEAMYGIRKPNEVKRQLIEIILERDQWDKQVVDLLEDQKKHRNAPAPDGRPPIAAAAEAAGMAVPPAPEPTPEPAAPQVAYYQPAPEPAPAPPPSRNYERIDTSHLSEPEEEDAEMPPPPPDEEEDPEPEVSPVRRMYPEARELDTPLQMEDDRTMDFESGKRPPPSPDSDDADRQEEEGWGKRKGHKPRSL